MLNSATENQGHGKGDGDGGGEGNVTAEPDETQNTAGLITKNQQLSGRSKYTVPSWICEQDSVVDLTMGEVEDAKIPADDNEEDKVFDESGDASFTLGVGDSGQRRNAFQDCMPMYQDICKLESAPGEYGKIPRNSECGAEERKEKIVQRKCRHEQQLGGFGLRFVPSNQHYEGYAEDADGKKPR